MVRNCRRGGDEEWSITKLPDFAAPVYGLDLWCLIVSLVNATAEPPARMNLRGKTPIMSSRRSPVEPIWP